MNKVIEINELALSDMDLAYEVFRRSIPDAFEQEGLVALTEEIGQEIEGKRRMLHDALYTVGAAVRFLVARMDGNIVGVISFGPCNDELTSRQRISLLFFIKLKGSDLQEYMLK
ncbi:hypothetical protein HQN89_32415 [Paenibacillus frigoriresistens]|uniref:hypothetical protein n=1 Tax=Paenibacillus alginolyticus TaxID=59839 RepID=UPI001565CF3E|nr:hypothetical protein [Paenibacillus frigoriresistens]NRF95548.1 hypothetical protein [Paenibacillus frigoriresistens]